MCEAGLRLGEGYRSPKSRPRLSGSCVEGTITFTLPVLEPDAVGEKVTLIAQLPFGPNGDPGGFRFSGRRFSEGGRGRRTRRHAGRLGCRLRRLRPWK